MEEKLEVIKPQEIITTPHCPQVQVVENSKFKLMAEQVYHTLFDIRDDVASVKKDVADIKKAVVPGKKQKRMKLALREPLTKEIYDQFMTKKRKKGESYFNYSRFRVALTLLFLTGLRVGEIKKFTKADVYTLLNGNVLEVTQPKTKSIRRISFGKKAVNSLKTIQKDIDTVFFKVDGLGGKLSTSNWITFVNKRLKTLTKDLLKTPVNLKSHSCRVNYTTELLKKLPLHQVSSIVGHADIRTTLIYNRYIPTEGDVRKASDLLVNE